MPSVTANMHRIRGGTFLMGSEQFYADEGPVHEVAVADFLIDEHPVTNRQFAAFVTDTAYVTTAERPLPAGEFPELGEQERAPGSLAFRPTTGPVPLVDWRRWWEWVPGAHWRTPFGAGPAGDDHPVVQVSFDDASAYAEWAGSRLPTEAEWEYAARGGGAETTYAWGDELRPGGALMANTWQGAFPYRNEGASGWRGTSPVGTFPPNGAGLVDMIGNVWEWTTSPYTARHDPDVASCCVADGHGDRPDRRALKGGSHLCAPEYCLRYRPPARSPQSDDTSTTNIGFRCVRDV